MARVLLVDDDPNFTFALTSLLTRGGHEVIAAHVAMEAIEAVKLAPFDVAFLDLRLPDVDGLTLIDELSALDPPLSMICLTGREDPQAVVQAMRKGALDYLLKPVDRQTLFTAVTTAAETTATRRAGANRVPAEGMPVGESAAWKRAMALVAAAANAPRTTVLFTGEPGVGKEVAAKLLHRLSKRSSGPLISANAAAFSPSLIESELFGHEAGAFTGATRKRRGLFEQAEGGFLFLDEIGELPVDLQSKLLRVLESRDFRRLGGEETITTDARLICATNRNLAEQVKKGLFRADLYERLRVFEVPLPPLRERRDDVPHLAFHFLATLGPELGSAIPSIDPIAVEALRTHAWPGNVRELRNVLERALVLAGGRSITLQHLPTELRGETSIAPSPPAVPVSDETLDAVERRHIVAVFNDTGGNVTHTATRLGLSRLALRKRLQKYGLKPVRS